VEGNEEEYDHFHYFPHWMRERQKDGSMGRHVLLDRLRPFVPHSRPVVDVGDEGLDETTQRKNYKE